MITCLGLLDACSGHASNACRAGVTSAGAHFITSHSRHSPVGNDGLKFFDESRSGLDPSDRIFCLDEKGSITGSPKCTVRRTRKIVVVSLSYKCR